MRRETFEAGWAMLCAITPTDPPGDGAALVWFSLFETTADDAWMDACRRACLRGKWFPRPPEMLELLVPLPGPTGPEAWLRCLELVEQASTPPFYRRGGELAEPGGLPPVQSLTDPRQREALSAVGGWGELQGASRQDRVAHRARFLQAFERAETELRAQRADFAAREGLAALAAAPLLVGEGAPRVTLALLEAGRSIHA